MFDRVHIDFRVVIRSNWGISCAVSETCLDIIDRKSHVVQKFGAIVGGVIVRILIPGVVKVKL